MAGPGNGKTPVKGTPEYPMPVIERSRSYGRRASDRPSRKLLKYGGIAVACVAPLFTAAGWALHQAFPSRAEWNESRVEEAAFHGSLNETLGHMRVTLDKQGVTLEAVKTTTTELKTKLEAKERRR